MAYNFLYSLCLTGRVAKQVFQNKYAISRRTFVPLSTTISDGLISPADNNAEYVDNSTDICFIGDGGLTYGIDDHLAAELEVTRAEFGSDTGDFGVTNVSFGGQYRFALQQRQLVP